MKKTTGLFLHVAPRARGYTFIEILVALSLLLLVLLITAPKLGKDMQHQTEMRSAAMRLTEDLRYLRQLAISSGTPTALVIPNDTLIKSHCQGYMMKKGLTGSEIIKVVDLHRLYRRGFLFVGYWDLDSSALHNPAQMNSGSPIKIHATNSGFDVGSWGNGSQDYIFLFSPEGTVSTNGNMPHFDNVYHIIIGESFTYSSSALLPGSDSTEPGSLNGHFQISAAWNPIYTVSVTPAGDIDYSSGLTAAASSIYSTGSKEGPGTGAPLPGSIASSFAPEILSIKLFPVNLNLPPNVDATVNTERFLKIVVKAKDEDRNQLYLKPEVTQAPDPGKPGTFSTYGSFPMDYNPETGEYCGVLEWYPPASSNDSDEFEISLFVSDVGQQVSEARRIQIINKDQICFETDRDGNFEVYVMYIDGSHPTNITNNPSRDEAGSWALNGGLVTHISDRLYGTDDVYVMNGDGTNSLNITHNTAGDRDPSWSPDGVRIAFASQFYGNYDIFRINADGSYKTNLTRMWGSISNEIAPAWSPECTRIAFASEFYGNYDIFVMQPYTSTMPLGITDDPALDTDPCWSPDGSEIVFSTDRDGNSEIYLMNADGTNPLNISNNPAEDREPCFSPGGTKIVFTSNRDGNDEIYVMDKDGSNPTNISNNPAADRNPQFGR